MIKENGNGKVSALDTLNKLRASAAQSLGALRTQKATLVADIKAKRDELKEVNAGISAFERITHDKPKRVGGGRKKKTNDAPAAEAASASEVTA